MKSPIVLLSRSDERKSSKGAKRDLTVCYPMAQFDLILFSNMIDNYRYCGIVLMGDGNERL